MASALRLTQRAAKIDPVQREDNIGFAQQFAGFLAEHIEGRAVVRRMIGREHRTLLEIGHDASPKPFSELDARCPELFLARAAAEHDHWPFRALD